MYAIIAYPLYALLAYTFVMVSTLVAYNVVPSAPPILGFISRCMIAYLGLIVSAFYGTVASAILKVLGLHYRYGQWTTGRAFKILGKYTLGVEFVVEGNGHEILRNTRPAVILGNHQTELDILMLGAVFPQNCSVTAKKSLRNVPVLGWFMVLSGSIFIDRVNRAEALKTFEGAAKTMKEQQQSVFLFPEGTRSYADQPTLLPFKKGAFHLAVQGQVPIIPTVAENYSRILNVKAKRFNAGKARVRVLPVIETKGKTAADVNDLMEQARSSMLKALEEMAQDQYSQTQGAKVAKKIA